jgi:uncharacterized protein
MRTLGLAVLLLLLCASMQRSAHSAGFNCSGSLQPDEEAICADDNLSKLDDDLNEEYKNLLSSFEGRNYQHERIESERKVQRAFLLDRRACRADADCIKSLYERRIADLRTKAASEVFDSRRKPQNPSSVNQALELLSLSLKCSSEPIQEGAESYSKYEHQYLGDATTLRVKEIIHGFEGFKFPDGDVKADITIPGINAATKTTVEIVHTAVLSAFDRVRTHGGGEIEIRCLGNRECVSSQSETTVVSCDTRSGASCPGAGESASPEVRSDTTLALAGLCPDQVENAAVALQLLIGAAKGH